MSDEVKVKRKRREKDVVKRALQDAQAINDESIEIGVALVGLDSKIWLHIRSAELWTLASGSGETLSEAIVNTLHDLAGTDPPPF